MHHQALVELVEGSKEHRATNMHTCPWRSRVFNQKQNSLCLELQEPDEKLMWTVAQPATLYGGDSVQDPRVQGLL